VLKTLTTEPPASTTRGFSAIAGSGALVGVAGPVIEGAGSTRSSTFSTPPLGGSTWSSSRRITEF
jgi:hypothetical protein